MARRMWLALGLALACLLVGQSPAKTCIYCNGMVSPFKQTLAQDLKQAKLVIVGTVANPRPSAQGPPGSGTTDFHIARVIKDEAHLGGQKVIELPRFIPVPDPRDPPKFIVFCDVVNGKIDPNRGRAVSSPAMVDYLEGMKDLPDKDRTRTLLYCFRFIAHPDEVIATDVYFEFARSTDQEIGDIGKHLAAAPLRKLLEDPRTPADRLGLYAFLLGRCGGDGDADFLAKMIKQPSERIVNVLDGVFGGYISMRPKQGWDLAVATLADARKPFAERFSVMRMLRFYHSWKPAESRPDIVRAFAGMVVDGEVADLAIEDLRRWQMWDLTGQILAQYGKQSHAAPIVRRGIVRYALCCPEPEARQFVDAVRRQDADLVRELEENLELDRPK